MAKWLNAMTETYAGTAARNPTVEIDLGFSGGSGRGISFYSAYDECGYRALLDRDHREARGPEKVTGKAGSGTIFHALQDRYHQVPNGEFRPGLMDLKFSGRPVDPQSLVLGWHQHDWYRDRYKPDYWGTVLHAERRFPQTDEQAQLMSDVVFKMADNPPTSTMDKCRFSMQLDLTTMATPKTVARWWEDMGVRAEPGMYGLDWKTTDSAQSNLRDQYYYRMQGVAYTMAWNALFPRLPLKGFWYVVITRTQQPKMEAILIPPPPPDRQCVVWAFFKNVWRKLNSDNPFEANPNACFAWFRMCSHLAQGRCAQYNPKSLVKIGDL